MTVERKVKSEVYQVFDAFIDTLVDNLEEWRNTIDEDETALMRRFFQALAKTLEELSETKGGEYEMQGTYRV
jgi:hypothetical protein